MCMCVQYFTVRLLSRKKGGDGGGGRSAVAREECRSRMRKELLPMQSVYTQCALHYFHISKYITACTSTFAVAKERTLCKI